MLLSRIKWVERYVLYKKLLVSKRPHRKHRKTNKTQINTMKDLVLLYWYIIVKV